MGPDPDGGYPAARLGWYAVTVLLLAYLISIIDRQVLALFLVPIQESMGVSDTAMGLLHGFSFAIFYAVMGLPISRWIDAGQRPRIIAAGIALWSLATAACGLATDYWQLLVARIFVGIGEATLLPGAVSLIADYFAPERRGRAMGLFAAGGAAGNGLSMLAGGIAAFLFGTTTLVLPWVGRLDTWQTVFVIIGLPGVLVALLLLTLRDPGRRGGGRGNRLPLSVVAGYLRTNAGIYWSLLAGIGVFFIAFLAFLPWTPALLIRRLGMAPSEAGFVFGLVLLVTGPLGASAGGWLADWWVAQGHVAGKLRVNILATLGLTLFGALFPLIGRDTVTLLCLMVPCAFLSSMCLGMAPASIQDVTPAPMRGQITALYTGILNLVGFGLGPLLVGAATDYLFRDPQQIHLSMSLVIGVTGTAALLILRRGQRHYAAARESAEAWEEDHARGKVG